MTTDPKDPVALAREGREELSPRARAALASMEALAKRVNTKVLGMEHLVLGVVRASRDDRWLNLDDARLSQIETILVENLWERREEYAGSSSSDGSPLLRSEALEHLRAYGDLEDPEKLSGVLDSILEGLPGSLRATVSEILAGAEEEAPADPEKDASGSDPDSSALGGAEGDAGEPDEGRSAENVPFAVPVGDEAPDALPLREETVNLVGDLLSAGPSRTIWLHGETGAGKSTTLAQLASALRSGRFPILGDAPVYRFDFEQVFSVGLETGVLATAPKDCLSRLARIENAVLLIDDGDVLFQPLPPVPMISLFRPLLEILPVRVVVALSSRTWQRHVEAEGGLPSGSVSIRLEPLPAASVRSALELRAELADLPVGEDALTAIVEARSMEGPTRSTIGSSLDLLEEAAASARREGHENVGLAQLESHLDRRAPHERVDLIPTLHDLESSLQGIVFRQDEAIQAVVRRIKQTKLRLDRRPERPDGVFLFVGPSGVGKTLLAKAICEVLYGNQDRMLRLDMSEYMEPHSVAKLIGSPPGYVGYREPPALTAPADRLGEGVLLLDEVEKAHPSVLNLFLQLFDEGFVTDSAQRRVGFSEFVVVMTSNLGTDLWEAVAAKDQLGFLPAEKKIEDRPADEQVLDHFLKLIPAEFLNRIDEVVPFRALSLEDLTDICRRLLVSEVTRWEEQLGKRVEVDEGVAEFLAETGNNPSLGARHLERNIERLVVRRLAELALGDTWSEAQTVRVRVEGGEVVVEMS